MIVRSTTILALVAVASLAAPVAQAGSLLGILGSPDSGSLVTVGRGDAGNTGVVNVGLGGGDGQLVDANIGGATPLVGANVSVGGPGGVISIDIGAGGPVGPGVPGVPGAPGGNGQIAHGGGSGGAFPSGSGACAGTNPNQLLGLFQQTEIGSWNRASNIQIVPIKVCADMRRQVGNWLAGNGSYHRMVAAVASDSLISAALNRTRYQPGHVLGVQRQGPTLLVYVF